MTDIETKPVELPGPGRRLRHAFFLLLGPVVIAAISVWLYLQGGRYVTTDNAYVRTPILSISSNVAGMVIDRTAVDGTEVKRGELLLRVDDQPYLIAVARAEAALANVRGEIESLRAELENRQLEIEKARTDLEFREHEMQRIRSLYEQNSISGVQYDQAVYGFNSAERELAEKKQALQVTRARLIDPGLPIDAHPRVKQALAELDKARLDLSHTEVKAPEDGVIANVSTYVGQNVMTGAPLMSLIYEGSLWLEANFKETDLTYLREGQPVSITVDAYPEQTWVGHVGSITPATGAEFSLLPAQNSTGNWVKVVQRVRVLIEFDDYQGEPLLASGMSAEVRVDTDHRRTLEGLLGRN